MTPQQMIILCSGLLVVSFLYSSVGHAGGSGYIAVMSLLGLAPELIRPVALILNILVAVIASWQFYRAGHFSWRVFWPYAIPAIPCAFLGGFISVPAHVFKILLGLILLLSAVVLIAKMKSVDTTTSPPRGVSLGVGAGMGFLAGITGTGGGILLTPTLILFRWTTMKTASATSALFILLNSIAGLLGVVNHTRALPSARMLAPLLVSVLLGGTVGSYLGSRMFPTEITKTFLACVLAIASIKLILG